MRSRLIPIAASACSTASMMQQSHESGLRRRDLAFFVNAGIYRLATLFAISQERGASEAKNSSADPFVSTMIVSLSSKKRIMSEVTG